MRLDELHAKEIVIHILGERGELKSEEELAFILKKRLTKKERIALNSMILKTQLNDVLKILHVSDERLETIRQGAIKKLKNEHTHREFYKN